MLCARGIETGPSFRARPSLLSITVVQSWTPLRRSSGASLGLEARNMMEAGFKIREDDPVALPATHPTKCIPRWPRPSKMKVTSIVTR
jgi:hypothetical protein